MDVHDVGTYKANGEWRAYEEGMVRQLSQVFTLRQMMKL